MSNKKRMTSPISSVGTDVEKSLPQNALHIISKQREQSNPQLKPAASYHLKTISMTALYDAVYPPRAPIIDNLLYAGTYLFVGAPKIGKSFFMAQLSYHVSMGLPLWDYPVHKGTVLYLTLEDDYARLQKRLSQMFGIESSDNLLFSTQANTLHEGLENQLDAFMQNHPDTRLIIIDTLQKIRERYNEHYSYANDYNIVTKLKSFSDKHNLCLLIVHHTRKMESNDSFDMISGTNGLLGAADGAFIMQKKKRTDATATIDIVGRDQQDQRLTLSFDRNHCIWLLSKAETELWRAPPDPILEEISKLFSSETTQWIGTASELISLLSGVDLQPNVFIRKLNVSTERLYNEYGIHYENKRTHDGRMLSFTKISNARDDT